MKVRTLEQVIAVDPGLGRRGGEAASQPGREPARAPRPVSHARRVFSDDPDDYLAGFPSHPHRGFETVTYMLDGHMQHKDDHGNTGDLGPGDVQWMSAARGIIHSDAPADRRPHARLPALAEPAGEGKMKPAAYRILLRRRSRWSL